MKTLPLFVALWIASLFVMIGVDSVLGARAEFINAWSVVERLLGREAGAGPSAVYRSLGAVGELVGVGLLTAVIGGVLTALVKAFVAK